MGKVFENLTDEELCDLMCGGPEDESELQTDCNTCDKAVRNRVGVIGCAKFDSKPTVAIPSAEPCEDAISRQALLKLMGEEPFNWTDSDKELQAVEDYRNFRNMVEQLPPVKPQPTGHWIVDRSLLPFTYTCDLCGRNVFDDYDYCPYCGANMRGDTDADSD